MTGDAAARLDCVVVGAGVVGLAVARALAQAGRDVAIVEAEPAIGTGVSARNSEVVHAGLYYPPGSLRARFCVRGKALLYAYCAERRVPHRRTGKLIVAPDPDQRAALAALHHNAVACGVDDLEPLDTAAAARLEPDVACAAALWSPSTGIVDSHALMLALLGDAEAAGATLALASRVAGGETRDGTVMLRIAADGVEQRVVADLVVNCAGLDATRVARAIGGVAPTTIPDTHPVKGNYFSLIGKSPFTHLVYPLPEHGGLGVHVTLDLAGRARFGPDVQWPSAGAPLDYEVDATRADGFAASIRRYWPGLPDDALTPAYAGFRPRIGPRDAPVGDFVIAGPREHGVPGLIHLFGIESPGLTSCLAIAEHVAGIAA